METTGIEHLGVLFWIIGFICVASMTDVGRFCDFALSERSRRTGPDLIGFSGIGSRSVEQMVVANAVLHIYPNHPDIGLAEAFIGPDWAEAKP